MRYLPHTETEIAEMLEVVGRSNVAQLFDSIPENVRFKGELQVPPALDEPSLQRAPFVSGFGEAGGDHNDALHAGRVAVIVGFGDLGQGAARAAHALGLRVLAVTRSGKASAPAERAYSVAAIDEALADADFVVIATPLTAETRGLFTSTSRLGPRSLTQET